MSSGVQRVVGCGTGGVRSGWRRIGKEKAKVIALNDLGHQASLDMTDFDKRWFKCKNIGIMES
jgi:precorrin-6B methylase 2